MLLPAIARDPTRLFNAKPLLLARPRAEAIPRWLITGVFLIDRDSCCDAVVTIGQAQGGVWLDYAHDRAGEPVVFVDEPLCATEAQLDGFGWACGTWLERHEPIYVPYDRLGEVLAARVEHYFTQAHLRKLPLQLAPVAKIFVPENCGPSGAPGVLVSEQKRPPPLGNEGRYPGIKNFLRKVLQMVTRKDG